MSRFTSERSTEELPVAPASSVRPVESRAPTSDRIGSARRESRDVTDRRRNLPRVFQFLLVGWSLFVALDVYSSLVLVPARSLFWMIGWRAMGSALLALAVAIARLPNLSWRSLVLLETSTFLAIGAINGLIACGEEGLASPYFHGTSLIILVQVMGLPARFSRAIAPALATMMTFPFVLGAASLVDARIAAQWQNGDIVARFFRDFVLVSAVATGGPVGGHLIWTTRRQLYHARRLGRYSLKGRIGSGGMGEVWLAWDGSLERDVALKILSSKRANDVTALLRFEREARLASSLRSPHTVRVYDFGASEDGVWFLAMEYLEGADLDMLVRTRGPLPAARVIALARQACASLGEAHDKGMVHRDIKPANLFVTRSEEGYDSLKLLDFGVAKWLGAEDDGATTNRGFVRGTPAYMSPECCAGKDVDARGDIYSLGTALYFLLTGTPPFEGTSAGAVMVAHVNETPEPPSHRLESPVDPALEKIIMKCLAKRPEHRFASVAELDGALSECKLAWTLEDARAFWSAFHPSQLRGACEVDGPDARLA